MTYKGIVKGTTIVIEPDANPADGTEMEVIPINQADPICGTWNDDRPAQDIVHEIRSSRYSRNKDIAL